MAQSHGQYVWCNNDMRVWKDASVHTMNYSMQYGVSAFEGIRFYATEKGPAIFRLKDHIDRLFYSMAALGMSRQRFVYFTYDFIKKAIIDLIRANAMDQGYIRPTVYMGEAGTGLPATDLTPYLHIGLMSFHYNPNSYNIRISSYKRISPCTTDVEAKISGHYVNSHLALLEAREAGFDDAILCDHEGYIAEAAAANIFWIKDNVCYTPPRGAILNGITRKTIMQIYRVLEQDILTHKLLHADEIFLCGTAYEIKPVAKIGSTTIGKGAPGPFTQYIAQLYQDIVHGKVKQCDHWLTYVNNEP